MLLIAFRHSWGVMIPSPLRSCFLKSSASASVQPLREYSAMVTWPSPSASLRRNESGNPPGKRSWGERKRYDFREVELLLPLFPDAMLFPEELLPEEPLDGPERERLKLAILAANSSRVTLPSPLASESRQVLLICIHSSFSRIPFLFLSYCFRSDSAYLRMRSSAWLGEPDDGGDVDEELPELDEPDELLVAAVGAGELPLEPVVVFAVAGEPKLATADACADVPNPGTRLAVALLASALLPVDPPGEEPGGPPGLPEDRWAKASRRACKEMGPAGFNPARRTIPS